MKKLWLFILIGILTDFALTNLLMLKYQDASMEFNLILRAIFMTYPTSYIVPMVQFTIMLPFFLYGLYNLIPDRFRKAFLVGISITYVFTLANNFIMLIL